MESYDNHELPEVLKRVDPHVGLLLSDFAETYSYALSEFMAMGVPPIARRIGALAERIVDQATGLFVADDVDEIVRLLAELAEDNSALLTIRQNLLEHVPRTAAQVVGDYERIHSVPHFSPNALNGSDLPAHAHRHLPDGSRSSRSAAPRERRELPITGRKVIQVGEASDYWTDHWVGPRLSVELFARAKVRKGRLRLHYPAGTNGKRASVAVFVNGSQVRQKDVRRGRETRIGFNVAVAEDEPFELELVSDRSEMPASEDVRELAGMLRQLRFW